MSAIGSCAASPLSSGGAPEAAVPLTTQLQTSKLAATIPDMGAFAYIGAALAEIRRIFELLQADSDLDAYPKLKILLLSLAELFLEPIQNLRS